MNLGEKCASPEACSHLLSGQLVLNKNQSDEGEEGQREDGAASSLPQAGMCSKNSPDMLLPATFPLQ